MLLNSLKDETQGLGPSPTIQICPTCHRRIYMRYNSSPCDTTPGYSRDAEAGPTATRISRLGSLTMRLLKGYDGRSRGVATRD